MHNGAEGCSVGTLIPLKHWEVASAMESQLLCGQTGQLPTCIWLLVASGAGSGVDQVLPCCRAALYMAHQSWHIFAAETAFPLVTHHMRFLLACRGLELRAYKAAAALLDIQWPVQRW